MKINLSIIASVAIVAASTLAFTPIKPKESVYKVDAEKSSIVWTGKKVTGEHTGNIKLSGGTLLDNGKSLTSGNLKFDMASITCNDIKDAEYNGKLLGHLRSDDFFSVDKHPTSAIVISNVKPLSGTQYEITGKLTIKGITNEISFPATISKKENVLVAIADVKIDRTKFDIKYGSGSFFEGLGDKAIDNEFSMKVNLVAKK